MQSVVLKLLGIVLVVSIAESCCSASPFGFDYSKSKAQIVMQVGKSHVTTNKDGSLSLDAAPRPYWLFRRYQLDFFTNGKLRHVYAGQSHIILKTSDEMRTLFTKVKADVVAIYGEPDLTVDCAAPREDERLSLCSASVPGRPSVFLSWTNGEGLEKEHLESILLRLEADPFDPETATIDINYEFEGNKAAATEDQRKQSPF